jgi:lipoprotein-anchoring transpeptidase ErfK/SrfK
MKRSLARSTAALLLAVIIIALALPPAAHAAQKVHVVRRGENLTRIAMRYGTSVRAIMNKNGIRNANKIYVGQRLRIPSKGSGGGVASTSSRIHVVRRGEHLAKIARKYGTSVAAIVTANGLRNANLVYVGQRLKIPGKSATTTKKAPKKSTNSAPASGGKWIDVDLSRQRVRAMQGNTVLKAFTVSTGRAPYYTPTGSFRVYVKYRSTTMSGPGYYLPGVPYTMYFYRGYALHGTYWHSNFGRPMSHGCINLRTADAKWLFNWSPKGIKVKIHR